MVAGIEHVYTGAREDFLSYDDALEVAFESVVQHACKANQEHFGELQSIAEVMQLDKGRLVAKGFSQRPGFDYNETFAPTPKWASIRAILALAALEDLELESVDISSTYLNGD